MTQNFTKDQRDGASILLISATMVLVFLVISDGWAMEGIPLVWFDSSSVSWLIELRYDAWQRTLIYWISQTRYVIALLLFISCYGVARYMSLLPPVFSLGANWLKRNWNPPAQ